MPVAAFGRRASGFDIERSVAIRPRQSAIANLEKCCPAALTALFELVTSMTTRQTNDLVKKLTFLNALIGFCPLSTGRLGMNFELSFFSKAAWVDFRLSSVACPFCILALAAGKWQRSILSLG